MVLDFAKEVSEESQLDRIEKKLDTLIEQKESREEVKKARAKYWEEIGKLIG